MTQTIRVPLDDLKALFDVAVQSMDFGSGFLDTDEVNMLRRIAGLIGVDPIKATPSNFATQYPHQFQQRVGTWPPASTEWCNHCQRETDDPIHQPAT